MVTIRKPMAYIMGSFILLVGFLLGIVVSPLSAKAALTVLLLGHCYVGVVMFFFSWLKNEKRIPKKMWIIAISTSIAGIGNFKFGDYFYKKSLEVK